MDRQESEILALQSIYDSSLFSAEKNSETGHYSGCYSCHFKLSSLSTLTSELDNKTIEVTYLSPISLFFTLPLEYPDSKGPNFTLSCSWLSPSQLIFIRDKLTTVHEENAGCEILFMWFMYLKDDALSELNIGQAVNLTLVAKECEDFIRDAVHNPTQLTGLDVPLSTATDRLRDCELFDIRQEAKDLLTTPFNCAICLCDRIGRSAAIVKPCRHMFCKECFGEYLKNKIVVEGSVLEIVCPAENCDSVITTSLVKAIVDDRTYERYDLLLLNHGLDALGDVATCPRVSCKYTVVFDKGTTSVTCPSCGHSFCVFCRQTYHGVAPCRFTLDQIEDIREKYLSGNETEKKSLEERYGKSAIKQALEEFDSTLFLKENCRQCPCCTRWCQKIEGCNKMTCTKCKTYFCWLCNATLNKNDPYDHYRADNPCGGRLFDGMDEFDDEQEEGEDEEEEVVQDLNLFD